MLKHMQAYTSHRPMVKRYFVHYRIKGNDLNQIEGHLELVGRKKFDGLGIKFHIGDRGSETPVDGYIGIGWAAAYWGIDFPGLGRFCEKLGRGHKRNISLRTFGGQLWWELWYDGQSGNDEYHSCDGWRKPKLWPWSAGRQKHRGWMCLREGNIELNPVSAFYGSRLWLKDESFEGQKVTALVPVNQFENDEYAVEFTLERREVRRRNGPKWAQRVKRVDYSADAECRPGIPVRNHSWKGDEILGWGSRVSDASVESGTWVQEAVQSTIDIVKRDRKHYNYHPPSVEETV